MVASSGVVAIYGPGARAAADEQVTEFSTDVGRRIEKWVLARISEDPQEASLLRELAKDVWYLRSPRTRRARARRPRRTTLG